MGAEGAEGSPRYSVSTSANRTGSDMPSKSEWWMDKTIYVVFELSRYTLILHGEIVDSFSLISIETLGASCPRNQSEKLVSSMSLKSPGQEFVCHGSTQASCRSTTWTKALLKKNTVLYMPIVRPNTQYTKTRKPTVISNISP